jgi:hypothetical protein
MHFASPPDEKCGLTLMPKKPPDESATSHESYLGLRDRVDLKFVTRWTWSRDHDDEPSTTIFDHDDDAATAWSVDFRPRLCRAI